MDDLPRVTTTVTLYPPLFDQGLPNLKRKTFFRCSESRIPLSGLKSETGMQKTHIYPAKVLRRYQHGENPLCCLQPREPNTRALYPLSVLTQESLDVTKKRFDHTLHEISRTPS